jgi:hypothetical protein
MSAVNGNEISMKVFGICKTPVLRNMLKSYIKLQSGNPKDYHLVKYIYISRSTYDIESCLVPIRRSVDGACEFLEQRNAAR